MKKIIISTTVILFLLVFASCEKDNYSEPSSILSGNVHYQGQPVGVRSNATQLELWQDGYALKAKIPVHIAWDGSYKATLFDGQYKMVRLSGAPWENQTDTIPITVRGNTIVDVPVTPYFIIKSGSCRKEGNTIVARFVIEKTGSTQNIELARLYVGRTILTDQNYNDGYASVAASGITLGQEVTLSFAIPASLASADYLFARIGVKATGVGELFYSYPEKIQLK